MTLKFSHAFVIRKDEPQQNQIKLANITKLLTNPTCDLLVQIEKFKPKRSEPQLRTWWRLIAELKRFMNSEGNNFTDQQVADYFKIKAGFYVEMENCKIPKSLAKKGDATKEDAAALLETLLNFSEENGLQLEITSSEQKEFIDFYNNK